LGSITYFKNPRRVLHSPNKTKKERNTFMRVFYKHYGLNYFGPSSWRGIAYVQNHSMHIQYPHYSILKILWAP
jgi:hypothetical protein